MSRRIGRSPNGEGHSNKISVDFNLNDENERRAWEVARRMARPHGRRKHMLVAIFNAIEQLERQLGQEVSADMITGMILAVGAGARPVDNRTPVRLINDDPNDLKIVTGTVRKATAQEQSNKALKKRGNLLKF